MSKISHKILTMYSDEELQTITKNTFLWHCFITACSIIIYMYLLLTEGRCAATAIFTNLVLPMNLCRLISIIIYYCFAFRLSIGNVFAYRVSVWNIFVNSVSTTIITCFEFLFLKMNVEKLLSYKCLIFLLSQFIIYLIYKYSSPIIRAKIIENERQQALINIINR